MAKVALADLNAADEAGFMAALGDVYEHAPWVAQAASRQRPFATLAALHAAMMAAVRAAPPDQQLAFIICVRRHSKDSILQEFERRLQNTMAAETETALGEIFRIAALRLDQRLEAADRLEVHGRLSTHVLDTQAGRPAAGVAVELVELSANGEQHVIARAMTNRDGRTDEPLI